MSDDADALPGRRVVVTGAGRPTGIGYAIAWAAAAAGAHVALVDLADAQPGEAARRLEDEFAGRSVFGVTCDVSANEQVMELKSQLQRQWAAPVDVLVNNAGIFHNTPAEEMPVDEWDRTLKVDLSSVFYCSRAFGTDMLARGTGAIVNISSMSDLIVNRPQPQAAYNVAKAGVIMLTKSLAAEWANRGVRVNAVAPGCVATGRLPDLLQTEEGHRLWIGGTPLGRLGKPAEVASAVVFVASDAASFITGETLVVDCGYTIW